MKVEYMQFSRDSFLFQIQHLKPFSSAFYFYFLSKLSFKFLYTEIRSNQLGIRRRQHDLLNKTEHRRKMLLKRNECSCCCYLQQRLFIYFNIFMKNIKESSFLIFYQRKTYYTVYHISIGRQCDFLYIYSYVKNLHLFII